MTKSSTRVIALNLCNIPIDFVHQYALAPPASTRRLQKQRPTFCPLLSTATREAKMHKPLAQALVMIAAAAVAGDEPSRGRRLAARRGRRRPVKRR